MLGCVDTIHIARYQPQILDESAICVAEEFPTFFLIFSKILEFLTKWSTQFCPAKCRESSVYVSFQCRGVVVGMAGVIPWIE